MGHDKHDHAKHDHAKQDHKKHGHTHDHKNSLTWVLVLTLGYMVAEIVGGLMSGSLALLADAGHMAIDSLAIVLSLFAAWIAHKPATDEKTYGYYRAEILAALLNGATLIAISFWIIFEAFHRINDPHQVQGQMMLVISVGGLLVNLISLAMVHKGQDHNLNMRGIWLHIATDVLGSVAAIAASFFVMKFGWIIADPIISVVISCFILWGAWRLVWDCVNVLLEGVPKEVQLVDVRKCIESVNGVKSIHDLHVWTVTSGVNSLSAHVLLKDGFDHVVVLKALTDLISHRFGITHTTIQIEAGDFSHEGDQGKLCSLEH